VAQFADEARFIFAEVIEDILHGRGALKHKTAKGKRETKRTGPATPLKQIARSGPRLCEAQRLMVPVRYSRTVEAAQEPQKVAQASCLFGADGLGSLSHSAAGGPVHG